MSNQPDPVDLINELAAALGYGGSLPAMSFSPKQVWEALLKEVEALEGFAENEGVAYRYDYQNYLPGGSEYEA